MRKRTKLTLLIGVITLAGFMAFMGAGSFANPIPVSVSANVAGTIQLSMPTTTVDFGGGMLTPGIAYNGVITASINSNRSYRLAVTKNRDLRSTTLAPQETIPSASLTFGATLPDGGTYNAPAGTLFDTDTRVVEGARGSGRSTTITYSLTVPWDQGPDLYDATHTYTATQI